LAQEGLIRLVSMQVYVWGYARFFRKNNNFYNGPIAGIAGSVSPAYRS
jgi:hypothetical protein